MIFSNFQAMRSISEHIRDPLTPETILELHGVLRRDTLDDPTAAGRLKHPGERIEVVDHRGNSVLHIPPPPMNSPSACIYCAGSRTRPTASPSFIRSSAQFSCTLRSPRPPGRRWKRLGRLCST